MTEPFRPLAPLRRWACLTLLALAATACVPQPIPVPRQAGAPCSDLTFQGFPQLEPAMRRSYFVCHNGLALQYAEPVRSALWVVERLDASRLDQKLVSREKEEFRPDAVLPKELTPESSRFTNSGYDRGHLAPAADFKENPAGMSHSFYTSNIVPQVPDNNRRIWARLENNVRGWAQQKGTVYVTTGPVYFAGGKPFTPVGWLALKKGRADYVIQEYQDEKKKKKKKPPALGIAVPSHLYKVIYDPGANTAIAFVVPNAAIPEDQLAHYATTVAEVERVTGLRFFPNLPWADQAKLKTQVTPQAWILGQ